MTELPTYPPMLCKNGDESMLGDHRMILQRKYDGSRVMVYKQGDSVRLIGRSFKNDFAPMYPVITEAVKRLPCKECILDAELTFFKGDLDVFVTALATDETKAQYEVQLVVFDALYTDEVGSLINSPLCDRLDYLRKFLQQFDGPIELALTIEDPKQHQETYQQIISCGGEGVVLKDCYSPYVPGKRTHWFKVKKAQTTECVVMGVTQGTGVRAETFGALILGQYDQQGRLQPIANCSGFTQAELQEMHALIGTLPEGSYPHIKKFRGEVQKLLEPTLIVEVEFMARTNSQKLRFPRFIRFREDKKPEECQLPGEDA